MAHISSPLLTRCLKIQIKKKSKMAAVVILKKMLNVLYQQPFDRFWWNLLWRCISFVYGASSDWAWHNASRGSICVSWALFTVCRFSLFSLQDTRWPWSRPILDWLIPERTRRYSWKIQARIHHHTNTCRHRWWNRRENTPLRWRTPLFIDWLIQFTFNVPPDA